jgi:hypothetical protein
MLSYRFVKQPWPSATYIYDVILETCFSAV